MKIKPLSAIFLSMLTLSAYTQTCNCEQEFNWVKETFEKNDAGFQYIIDKKGITDYNQFTENQLLKTKNVTDIKECEIIMSEWLKYFRKFHLFVSTFDNDYWKSLPHFIPSGYTPIIATEKVGSNSENTKNPQKRKNPYIKALTKNTLYFYIPSFEIIYRTKIDSVLRANKSLLKKTPNLIIDIRDSRGGTDVSFREIIPFLYTNPIRTFGAQIRATELNKKGYLSYAKMYENDHDTISANICKDLAKQIEDNMGQFFIPLNETPIEINSSYVPKPYPKKIGIICDRRNGSTDEEFLFIAKQSSKVKVFGRTTLGSLDISNMNYSFSPSGIFWMGVGMTKSFRIPDFCIDNIGLQPDYFIDSTVNDWITFTQDILEQK